MMDSHANLGPLGRLLAIYRGSASIGKIKILFTLGEANIEQRPRTFVTLHSHH